MNTQRLSLMGVALAALALAGCSADLQADAKIEANLQEANRQALIGNTQQAKVWADRAIQAAPQRSETYTSPPTDLSDVVPDAMEKMPDRSILSVFSNVGDDTTIVSYMHDAVRKFPDNLDAWESLTESEDRLGQTAQKQQDAKLMAAQIEKMLAPPMSSKVKIDGQLLARLGQAYCDSGDEVNGEKNYRRAIATYSTDPTPLNGLAYHFAQTNNTAHLGEALTMAQSALKLLRTQSNTSSDELNALILSPIQDTIGWVQYRQGDYKGALMNLMDAAAGDPRQPETRYHLAMVYLAMGDKFGARTELRHALLLNHEYAAAEQQANLLQNVPPPAPEPDDSDAS